MITGSVGFLILQISTQTTLTGYSLDIARWVIAGDLYVNTWLFGENFLNEVPMADYLDQVMQEENSPVLGYTFNTPPLNWYLEKSQYSSIADYSMQHKYTLNI